MQQEGTGTAADLPVSESADSSDFSIAALSAQQLPANISRFTFQLIGSAEELRVVEFSGTESISSPFEYQLTIASRNDRLDAEQFITQSALLTFVADNSQGEQNELLHGHIARFEQYSEQGDFFLYRLTLVPHFWFLQKRRNHRMFQSLSVIQIIDAVFTDAGINPEYFELRLSRDYPPLEYSVQYAETEFEFISRLMADNGLHYHFEHQLDRHVMVIADHNGAFPAIQNDSRVAYHPGDSLNAEQQVIYRFYKRCSVQHGSVSLRDYSFKKPQDRLNNNLQADSDQALEDYHYPGDYNHKPALLKTSGIDKTRLALQQHQTFREQSELQSNCQRLRAGMRYELADNPNGQYNQQYLLTHIEHRGSQTQSLDEYAGSHAGQYSNEAQCIPAQTPFKTDLKINRPCIAGYQSAAITGPSGEEIYTNEHAQSKVQFPWDREAQQNENSSCWLRSNQHWAGKNWGSISLPRINQEAKVGFIHGDPQRPVITGRLYNERQKPPLGLAAQQTRSTFKSNSTLGGKGFNEIRFEDRKAHEQVYFHAEKDLDIRAANDRRDIIQHDRHLIVDNNRYEHIKDSSHHRIDNNQIEKTGNNQSISIGETQHVQAGQAILTDVGNNIHLKAGQKIVLEAGVELTIKAGGGFIKIDPSGITAQGSAINLNSGTGAASAGAASPERPLLAAAADSDRPGQRFKAMPPQTVKEAGKISFKGEVSRVLHSAVETALPEINRSLSKMPLNPSALNPSALNPSVLNSLKKATVQQTKWLELMLLDNEDNIVPFMPYQVKFAYGEIKKGKLDKNAFAHINVPDSGDYTVVFFETESDNTQQKVKVDPLFAQTKETTDFNEIDTDESSQLVLEKVNRFRLMPYQLTSTYAYEQLHSLADDVAEITFMAFIRSIFGADISVSASSKLYRELSDGKVINPEIIVTAKPIKGHKAAYSNKEKIIYVYKGFLKQTLQDNDRKAELLTALVEEYGHHIDNLLRTQYSSVPVSDTDTVDEGAKYAYNLFNLNAFNQTETYFADIKSPRLTGQMILDISEIHNSLVSYVLPEQQNDDNAVDDELEFFGARSKKELNKKRQGYNHYTIEEVLVPDFVNTEQLNYIYFGNWLRDFSQLITGETIRKSSLLQQELSKQSSAVKKLLKKPESSPTLLSHDALVKLIEIMAVKEFQYDEMTIDERAVYGNQYETYLARFTAKFGKLSKEKLGFYRPEEHIDNPSGLQDEHKILSYTNESGKKISLYAGEKAQSFDYDKKYGVANYIIKDLGADYPSAVSYMQEQLKLTMLKGADSKGLVNLGAALHVLEDYFSHSNFVEISLIKSVDTEVYPWVQVNDDNIAVTEPWVSAQGTKINKQAARYPVVTGKFGLDDTVASVAPKLADILFARDFEYTTFKPGERTFQDVAILTVLNDLKTAQQSDSNKHNTKYQGKDVSLWIGIYNDYLKFRDFRAEKIQQGGITGSTWEAFEYSMQSIAFSLTFISRLVFNILLNSINEDIAEHQTFIDRNYGLNPSHTQLAKDPVEHHFNALAGELAKTAVAQLAEKLKKFWMGAVSQKDVLNFAESFFAHPLKTSWQDKIVINWAKQNPDKLQRSHSKTTLEYNKNIVLEELKTLEKLTQDIHDFFKDDK